MMSSRRRTPSDSAPPPLFRRMRRTPGFDGQPKQQQPKHGKQDLQLLLRELVHAANVAACRRFRNIAKISLTGIFTGGESQTSP